MTSQMMEFFITTAVTIPKLSDEETHNVELVVERQIIEKNGHLLQMR
jgi:hypothetical protein